MFGAYGPEIRYAALSLDDRGLTSYGSCSVVLRDELCQNCATLLEENSYSFVRRHTILPGDPIPQGRRSLWLDRQYLATAKLSGEISARTKPESFPDLLLKCEGDRATDRFIEVHLYGSFGPKSFVAAALPQPKKVKDRVQRRAIEEARDRLEQLKIPCSLI